MNALEAMELIERLEEELTALQRAKGKLEVDGDFCATIIEKIISDKVAKRNELADKLRAVNL